ncbi:hypothetical protein SDC9_16964 [bioreactor metagenome]|uniref:Uncharacterized protein n=1 Tax=bioreactor metagenome TaxID=1076179 RepID=A0A644TZW8_9ZZZZ
MISALAGQVGLYILIVSSVAELAYLNNLYIYRYFPCNRESLIQRLEAYALLKAATTCEPDGEGHYQLTAGGHEVLLGTLKKIEAKSAVLSTILVFAIGAFLAYGFSGGDDHVSKKMFAAGVIVLLLLPLGFSFVGIRHLDVVTISDAGELSGQCLASRLQTDLVKDLSLKEYGFRFSLNASGVVIISAILVIVLDAFTNLQLCASGAAQ